MTSLIALADLSWREASLHRQLTQPDPLPLSFAHACRVGDAARACRLSGIDTPLLNAALTRGLSPDARATLERVCPRTSPASWLTAFAGAPDALIISVGPLARERDLLRLLDAAAVTGHQLTFVRDDGHQAVFAYFNGAFGEDVIALLARTSATPTRNLLLQGAAR